MSSEDKDPEAVARGLKGTLNNPRVSEGAKLNAQERLTEMGAADEIDDTSTGSQTTAQTTSQTTSNTTGGNEGNIIGGYKATLKNPRVSDEAKVNAEQELQNRGVNI